MDRQYIANAGDYYIVIQTIQITVIIYKDYYKDILFNLILNLCQ